MTTGTGKTYKVGKFRIVNKRLNKLPIGKGRRIIPAIIPGKNFFYGFNIHILGQQETIFSSSGSAICVMIVFLATFIILKLSAPFYRLATPEYENPLAPIPTIPIREVDDASKFCPCTSDKIVGRFSPGLLNP